MHAGRLDADTAAARVYRHLRNNAGQWVGGWELAMETRTTAVSTRISEVRLRLRGTGQRVEVCQVGKTWWYRIVNDGRLL